MKDRCDNNKKQNSFIRRIESKLDIPCDIINEIAIDIRGRNNITIKGCKKILLYTLHEVRIKLRGETLCIIGENLYCTAYHSQVIEIDGYIYSVSFL